MRGGAGGRARMLVLRSFVQHGGSLWPSDIQEDEVLLLSAFLKSYFRVTIICMADARDLFCFFLSEIYPLHRV